MQTRSLPDPPLPSLPTTTPPSTEPASPPHDPHQRMTTTESLRVMINEDEISFASRYGLELSDAPKPGYTEEEENTATPKWFYRTIEQTNEENDEFKCESCTSWFNLASEGITIAMLRDRAPGKLFCTECKMTAKTNSSPISPLRAEPKEEASATINPQPFSPTSSPFPSTSHNSKLVSSPHSNIIPMAQEQISPVVKMGKRMKFGSKIISAR